MAQKKARDFSHLVSGEARIKVRALEAVLRREGEAEAEEEKKKRERERRG